MFPSLRRPDFAFLDPLEARTPDIVGTARGLSLDRELDGGGGGRQGAIGGGGFSRGLLLAFEGLFSGSLIRNFSPGFVNLITGILKLQGCWSLARFLMMRRTGPILFDLVLRMNMTVEIRAVTPTSTVMMKMTIPNALKGLSLLFIKKAPMGPLRWACKKKKSKNWIIWIWMQTLMSNFQKTHKHEKQMRKALTEEGQTQLRST